MLLSGCPWAYRQVLEIGSWMCYNPLGLKASVLWVLIPSQSEHCLQTISGNRIYCVFSENHTSAEFPKRNLSMFLSEGWKFPCWEHWKLNFWELRVQNQQRVCLGFVKSQKIRNSTNHSPLFRSWPICLGSQRQKLSQCWVLVLISSGICFKTNCRSFYFFFVHCNSLPMVV